MKKIYVWHSEKAVKDYVSDVAGVVTFLHLSKNPCNAKIASYTSKEFGRLEKELNDECEKLHKFLTNVQSKLRDNLVKGVKEAEKHCLTNGRKVLEPKKKCYRGFHKTLKALCKYNGYFRCGNGDVFDLNYTLAEPMYANMNDVFLQTFSPGSSRQSIYGKLGSFQESFIAPWDLDACKKEPEKYLRKVYIKTKQRKLLSSMEKEIVQRKKSIHDSLSKSVQATMMTAFRDFSGTGTYTLANIQDTLKEKIQSSKNTIFQQAMNEMLRQFEDLKTWTVKELETQMTAHMRVALGQIPDDFINLPDVDEELQNMKSWCEVLDLRIFM
ncbi:nuclear GTPase SLIP-GC-like [Scleropages formosus]|uniref:nuclear GTPase SLIP-GC-like n=1 Tax=Scleropages formosus TaxID=113540 RepID=UPI0010FA9593|nr:nuclear GTPase SLIP-GC-like [Scleropages formosus]